MDAKQVLTALLGKLWERYKSRVSYAAQYEKMVLQKGGEIHNDHIAFRTFNCDMGDPSEGFHPAGITAISRIFEPLGYQRKDRYDFTEKKLTAYHFEHASNPENPKIFISQLEVDKLPESAANIIKSAVKNTHDPLTSTDLELLFAFGRGEKLDEKSGHMLTESLAGFFSRPWEIPARKDIEEINKTSQYAAWTLLHGNSVNHFTAYINKQNVKDWPDIEATVEALRMAGIPMKKEYEGEKGTKLRQSSTEAVMEKVEVLEDNGTTGKIDWSYAYYELAERGKVNSKEFTGFLGEQATNLFEMTKTKE
jgi:hypothetical protein